MEHVSLRNAQSSLFCLSIFLFSISVTEADYDFIIHFYEFFNPLGLQCGECGNGGPPGCCDDVQRRENCNTTRPFTCDTRFRFILRPFGASLETAPNHTSFPHITCGKDNNSYTFSEGPQGFLNLHNPFVITMRGQWLGRLQFFIDAFDKAVLNSTVIEKRNVINHFPIDMELEQGANFTKRTTYTGFYNISGLGFDMSFRVQCSVNYYGTNCDTFCEPLEGVYKCSSEGMVECTIDYEIMDSQCIACYHPNLNTFTNCIQCLHSGYNVSSNCTSCLSGRDPSTNCSECLPGFSTFSDCAECAKGRDPATNCTDCLPGYDKSQDCKFCLSGFDVGSRCTKCLSGYDIWTNCTQCSAGRNVSTQCTECLVGYNSSTQCTTCLSGRDINYNCSKCTAGLDISTNCSECVIRERNPLTNCTTCLLSGYDPSSNCSQCLPNHDPLTNCSSCEFGWDLSTSCTECLQNRNRSTSCHACNYGSVLIGRTCISVNPCASSPCQNGGTCEAIYGLTAAGYHCICEPGYMGLFCQTIVISTMHSLSAVEGDTVEVLGATLGAFVGVLILASLGLTMVIVYLGCELRKGKLTGTCGKKSGGQVLLQTPSSGDHRALDVSGSSYTLHNPVYDRTNVSCVSTTDNRMVISGDAEQKLKSGNEMTTYDIAYPNFRSALEGKVYDVAHQPPRPEGEQGGYDTTVHSVSQPKKVQVANAPEYDYADVPQQQNKNVSSFESAEHPSYSCADTDT